jgi:hypothetical protein
VARFGRLDSCSGSGTHSSALSSALAASGACSLAHSELDWWGLKISLRLHLAHLHCGSHYSVRSF